METLLLEGTRESLSERVTRIPVDEVFFLVIMEAYIEIKHEEFIGMCSASDVSERKLVLRPWQIELEKMTKGEGHVYWVWDHFGAAGKTKWMRWLSEKRGDEVNWAIKTIPKRSLERAIKCGWDGTLMIFDFFRSEKQGGVYKSIELVRSSRIYDAKRGMKSPNVYVLTHFLPDIHKLAKDRWTVCAITHNYRDFPRGPPARVKKVNGVWVEEKAPDMRILTSEEVGAYRGWVKIQRKKEEEEEGPIPDFMLKWFPGIEKLREEEEADKPA